MKLVIGTKEYCIVDCTNPTIEVEEIVYEGAGKQLGPHKWLPVTITVGFDDVEKVKNAILSSDDMIVQRKDGGGWTLGGIHLDEEEQNVLTVSYQNARLMEYGPVA